MSFQPTDSAYKKFGVLQEQPQDMRGMFPIRDRVDNFLTSQGLTPEIPNQGPTVPSSMFFREAERHTPGINDNIIRLRNLLQSGQRLPQAANPFGLSDDEIQRRRALRDIIDKPGYDPASVTEAQKQWIELMQQSQVRGV